MARYQLLLFRTLFIFHLFLHVVVPLVIAWLFFRGQWQRAFVIMLATMVVDLDHLLATPIYDPLRCSIGFHPLHGWLANAVYCLLAVLPTTRLIGLGLVIHMLLDAIDCCFM